MIFFVPVPVCCPVGPCPMLDSTYVWWSKYTGYDIPELRLPHQFVVCMRYKGELTIRNLLTNKICVLGSTRCHSHRISILSSHVNPVVRLSSNNKKNVPALVLFHTRLSSHNNLYSVESGINIRNAPSVTHGRCTGHTERLGSKSPIFACHRSFSASIINPTLRQQSVYFRQIFNLILIPQL
jgi:hypothetical protein